LSFASWIAIARLECCGCGRSCGGAQHTHCGATGIASARSVDLGLEIWRYLDI
jgi:hypothetical protein